MKTLYVNINSQDIVSNGDVEVMNYDLDSDLYFAIGDKLVEGTGQRVNKIDLITQFNVEQYSAEYSLILDQCEQLKRMLFNGFSQNTYEISLPDSYETWLKYHSNDSYRMIHMKYSDKPIVITLDICDVYEDSIESLQRRIIRYLRKNDLYKLIDKVIFSDRSVSEDSKIIQAIKREYPHMSFVPLDEWKEDKISDVEDLGLESCICNSGSDEVTQYLFITRNGDYCRETYDVYDSSGNKVEKIEHILPVGYWYYDDRHTFIIGMNTKDEMLYFVSNKQILPLYDWSDGQLLCEKYNGQLHQYRHRKYGGFKQLFIEDDNASFYIRDRYDYETYYKVEDGFCYESTADAIRQTNVRALYYMETEDYEDRPKCMSTITGKEFTIPGFKAIIYLGNTNGRDVFWASKKFQTGQVRFRESYIIDSVGDVIRSYDYNFAYPLCGKYILDINDRGRLVSISNLDGNQVMSIMLHLYVEEYNIGDTREVEPGVFYIPAHYDYGQSLYWLEKENVICDSYDKNFYYIGNVTPQIYRRGNNELVGSGDELVELDGIYFCQNFKDKGYYYMTFFDDKGEEIYRLNKDHYFRESVVGDGDGGYCVGENRIVLDIEGRYYKIFDYTAKEIARIDPVQLVGRYRKGKLFYYSHTELGFFDIEGKKYILPFDKGNIESVDVINDSRLLVKTISDVESFYLLNYDGEVLLEGINSGSAKFDHRFIAYYKEETNFTTCYVFDLDGNELFKTETSPCYVSVIDGGIIN